MTAVAHPLSKSRELVALLIAAAVAVGVAIALMLAFATSGDSHLSRPVATRTPTVSDSGFVGTVNSGPDNPSSVSFVGTVNSGPDNPARVGSPILTHSLPSWLKLCRVDGPC